MTAEEYKAGKYAAGAIHLAAEERLDAAYQRMLVAYLRTQGVYWIGSGPGFE